MLTGNEEDGSQADDAAQGAADTAASATADKGTDNQDQGAEGQDQGANAGADQGQQQGSGDGQGNAIANAAAEAKAKDPTRPFQQRIDELTRNWRGTERELTAARQRIAELEGRQQQGQQEQQPSGQQQDGQQPISLDPKIINDLADKRAREIAAADAYNNACNAAFEKGLEVHGDAFKSALQTCGQFGVLDDAIVADALATDAPHEVLFALGKDPEKAMQLARLPQAKRLIAFAKLAEPKIASAPAVSKAPKPVAAVNGNSGAKDFNFLDPEADDAEWHRRMDEQDRARRAAR